MEVPPAPVPVMETADLADFYVPEAVKLFLPHFRRMVLEKVRTTCSLVCSPSPFSGEPGSKASTSLVPRPSV